MKGYLEPLAVLFVLAYSFGIPARRDFKQTLDEKTRQARQGSYSINDYIRWSDQQEIFDPRAQNNYKFKDIVILKPTKAATPAPSSTNKLTIYDYKRIWIHVITELYRIIEDRDILREDAITTKIVKFLFKVLSAIRHVEKDRASKDPHCPKGFNQIVNLCLCIDFIEQKNLTWSAARSYCQNYKGADLFIYRDYNEFYAGTSFAQAVDTNFAASYWIGGEKVIEGTDPKDRVYRGIDGGTIDGDGIEFALVAEPFGATDSLTSREYLALNRLTFYAVNSFDDTDDDDEPPVVPVYPLCQFIATRDKDNFLYGQAVAAAWYDWAEEFEWKSDRDRKRGEASIVPADLTLSALDDFYRRGRNLDAVAKNEPLVDNAAAAEAPKV